MHEARLRLRCAGCMKCNVTPLPMQRGRPVVLCHFPASSAQGVVVKGGLHPRRTPRGSVNPTVTFAPALVSVFLVIDFIIVMVSILAG